MYEQLTQNEKLNKVIEMIDALRSEVVGIKNEISTKTIAAETVEETVIEHEGLKLKRVDREAKDSDYIRMVELTRSKAILKDKIYGPVENGLVESNEEEFSEEQWPVYDDKYNRTPSTVEVFEVIDVLDEKLPFTDVVEEKPKLTANQQRILVIQEAKQFIASKVKDGITKIGEKEYKVHFHRNGKTITCILNDLETGYTTYVNKANCHPKDVFNDHIGQAIALGGIIGTPKKIFLNAVQPKKVEIGMRVRVEMDFPEAFRGAIHKGDLFTVKNDYEGNGTCGTDSAITNNCTIIDDTNAKYTRLYEVV